MDRGRAGAPGFQGVCRQTFWLVSAGNRANHAAGDLAFDRQGNLYASTGDNTFITENDSFAPIDERPGRQFWDAQRTAANTMDFVVGAEIYKHLEKVSDRFDDVANEINSIVIEQV